MVLTRQACSASCDDYGVRECGVLTRASASGAAATTSGALPANAVLPRRNLNLLELPPEITMKILGYLPMKKVAETRLVSRRFNAISGEKLTGTFQRLQAHVQERFNAIKAQMPRRESARRHHPRAREADIMETLSMRLTLLQMAFGRHIQKGHICFFPGEILDEVLRILSCMNTPPDLQKDAYKVTEELVDLSSMAMEYFKEKLEPTLREISYLSPDFTFWDSLATAKQAATASTVSTASSSLFNDGASFVSMPLPPPPPVSWRDETESISSDMTSASGSTAPASDIVMKRSFHRIRLGMQKYNSELIRLRKDLKLCKTRVACQNKLISKYHNRLDEYDKKFEENTKKFSTLIQELNKCKTELQYWRSKAPHPSEAARKCENCGHITLAPLPVDDNDDLAALAHQVVKMDPPASSGLVPEDVDPGPSGVGGPVPNDVEQDGACCHSLTRALAESSESEGEAEFAEPGSALTVSSPTLGAKKGGKKAVQQRPLLGKRKRKSVDPQTVAVQNQAPSVQQAPACVPMPPPSPKNLRCKAGKQPPASNVVIGAGGANKRLKLV